MFWHLHTMHSSLLSVRQCLFHFYCQLYTVYPALLIVSFPFPSFCSTLLLSSYHHTSHTGFRAWRVAVNLTPPGLFFYCLAFNTFLKILAHLVPCLFQVSVLVRQKEMTGGGYSPSLLPVQEAGGSLEGATEEERV